MTIFFNSSNSEAFTDDNLKSEAQIVDVVFVENSVGRGEMLVTSNHSFSDKFSESLLSQGRLDSGVCGKVR